MDIIEKNVPNFEILLKYVLYKIEKITKQYKEYQGINPFNNNNEVSDEILKKLKGDKSHITLKLRQVLNLIRFNTLKEYSENNDTVKYSIKIDTLLKKIKEIKNDNLTNEELIPIGCYQFNIKVKNDKENENSISEMNTLSSGEQHFIHTIHSALYHILNVNSVHNSEKETEGKIKYNYINLIFDEIELYFHPEYQRRFIFEFLEKLKGIETIIKDKIKGINMLFCTHSPFILSDIPKQNVLFFGNNRDDKQTFAANISTMLSNSFFMNDLIGEFSKRRIEKIINWLNQKQKQEDENILAFIELLDEPILKYKLREMYYNKFKKGSNESKEVLKNRLKAYAQQLGFVKTCLNFSNKTQNKP